MSRSEAAPAFQLYAADALADTASMTHAEAGMYWRLVCQAWRDRGLPTDRARLAILLNLSRPQFDRAWPIVGAAFVERDGRLVLPWQEAQRAKQAEVRAKRSESGKLGNERRWQSGSDGDETPSASHTDRKCDADAIAKGVASDRSAVAVASASAVQELTTTTTTAAGARENFPDVVVALSDRAYPDLLRRFEAVVGRAAASYFGMAQRALGVGRPGLTPTQLAQAVDHWLANIATGSEGTANAGRFEAYLQTAIRRARELAAADAAGVVPPPPRGRSGAPPRSTHTGPARPGAAPGARTLTVS